MKVLRIVPTMNPERGGVAEAAKQSAIFMKKENVDVHILCFDNPRENWIRNAKYTVIPLDGYITKYGINLSYLKWMFNNIKKYDLVIIDGLWMFHVVGGYVCKLLGVPYIVYTHGMLDPYFNIDRLKYLKKLPFWFLIDRNVLAMAKSIVFTCEEEMELAQNSFPAFRGECAIATLGIATNSYPTKELIEKFLTAFPHLENKKIGLYLSRIHPKKGLDLLIEAVGLHKEELPDNMIFVIAGSGDESYIKKLKYQVAQLGLKKYFEWVGMLSGDVKWGAFTSAEFFILPSHQENFGIVVAEALSVSTPVLTTNKVNIWKEVEKAHAGIIVNDNLEGISSLIDTFIQCKENKYLEMKKNAYKCYSQYFSVDAFRRDFLKLLRSAVAERTKKFK